MTNQKKSSLFAIIFLFAVGCTPIAAQTPAPAPTPSAKISPATDLNRLVLENKLAAPQVVTILHRLNGLKLLTLLMRSREEFEAIANLDQAFKLAGEVHTNVIAGLALDDGKTIAAWLPEAE